MTSPVMASRRKFRSSGRQVQAETQSGTDRESEIEEMRAVWKDLAAQREKAFIRKMIMLGHLPPTTKSNQ